MQYGRCPLSGGQEFVSSPPDSPQTLCAIQTLKLCPFVFCTRQHRLDSTRPADRLIIHLRDAGDGGGGGRATQDDHNTSKHNTTKLSFTITKTTSTYLYVFGQCNTLCRVQRTVREQVRKKEERECSRDERHAARSLAHKQSLINNH